MSCVIWLLTLNLHAPVTAIQMSPRCPVALFMVPLLSLQLWALLTERAASPRMEKLLRGDRIAPLHSNFLWSPATWGHSCD